MKNKSNSQGAIASGTGTQTKPQPRIKEVDRRQMLMRAVDIEQLVRQDDEVRAIWEMVGRLDLGSYHDSIRAVEGVAGREPVDPRVLISLWIYSYSKGVSSAREISRLCEYHPAYQWLTGMQMINHHTLSDFRVDHQKAMDELFTEVLGVLSAEGLVTLERVMHDGTKIKASAGSGSFRRKGRLRAHLELARRQVGKMGDPRAAAEVSPKVVAARQRAAREKQKRLEVALEELEKIRAVKRGTKAKREARASRTDPEARIMKQSNGGYAPSYNVQLSTDAKVGVIVEVGVSQSGSDYEELLPAVERIEKRLGAKPKQMVADGGFTSRENILGMNERGVDFIGSMGKGANQSAGQMNRRGVHPSFRPRAFRYDEARDTYTCPADKTLGYESKEKKIGRTNYKYRARGSDCLICPFKKKCCPQNAARGRSIVRGVEDAVVKAFRAKMQNEDAKEIYKKRAPIAEFPNAWIKDKIGLRQFRLRGQSKVEIETLWVCMTYNIQQWIRLCWRPQWQAATSGG